MGLPFFGRSSYMKRLPRALQFIQLAILPASYMRLTPNFVNRVAGSKVNIDRFPQEYLSREMSSVSIPLKIYPTATFKINHSYIEHSAKVGSHMTTALTEAYEEVLT